MQMQYLELDGAGHCPHHEAPLATNTAIAACLDHMEEVRAWQRASQESVDGADVPPQPQPPLPVRALSSDAVGLPADLRVCGGAQLHVADPSALAPGAVGGARWRCCSAVDQTLLVLRQVA
jgi:hypothetical protein